LSVNSTFVMVLTALDKGVIQYRGNDFDQSTVGFTCARTVRVLALRAAVEWHRDLAVEAASGELACWPFLDVSGTSLGLRAYRLRYSNPSRTVSGASVQRVRNFVENSFHDRILFSQLREWTRERDCALAIIAQAGRCPTTVELETPPK